MDAEILHEITLFLYHLFLIPVGFFSFLYYMLALRSMSINHNEIKSKNNNEDGNNEDGNWPMVTIQIPVYNDPVAIRCIEHCLNFDYPRDRYEIIIADDSDCEKTKNLIDNYSKYENVRIIRRNHRNGFKAGALNNVLRYSNGEIIVVFDSDYTPPRDFLKRIIAPFLDDDEVVCVQARMSYINSDQNLITKFASICLMNYHNCYMPINQKLNIPFFCGTGGAIRKSVLEEVGGWNEESITEDADLSVRLIDAGYKHVYLPDLRTPGEVPFTLRSFIKQQKRWCYGLTRVFIEHWKKILLNAHLSIPQRFMLAFITLGYCVCPFVVGMTLFGTLGWFIGKPKPILISDIIRFVEIFIATSGFLFSLLIALGKEGRMDLLKHTIIAALTIGIVVSITNSIAFLKAIFGRNETWVRTPKLGLKG